MLIKRSSSEQNSVLAAELAVGKVELGLCTGCDPELGNCMLVTIPGVDGVVVSSFPIFLAASLPEARAPLEVRFGLRLNIIGVFCLLLLVCPPPPPTAVPWEGVCAAEGKRGFSPERVPPEGIASEGVIMAVEGEREERARRAWKKPCRLWTDSIEEMVKMGEAKVYCTGLTGLFWENWLLVL